MQSYKIERVEKILKDEINFLIVMGKIKDPRVSSRVSVLHTKVSRDLTAATVYISAFFAHEKLEKTVEALNHAKGYIQSEIAKKHKWRHTPKLLFKASDGLMNAERVEEALAEKFHLLAKEKDDNTSNEGENE